MSDDPRDFPTVRTPSGGWRYAYSWEVDAMERCPVCGGCGYSYNGTPCYACEEAE